MKLRNCLNDLSKGIFSTIKELSSILAEIPVSSGDDFSLIIINLCNGCESISRRDIRELNLFSSLLDNLLVDDCLREFDDQSNVLIKMQYHFSILFDTLLSTYLKRENLTDKLLRQVFSFFRANIRKSYQQSVIGDYQLNSSPQEIKEYIKKYKFKLLAALFGVDSDIYNHFFTTLVNLKVVNNNFHIDTRLLNYEFEPSFIYNDRGKHVGEVSYAEEELNIYIYSLYKELLHINGYVNVRAFFINGGKSTVFNADVTSSHCMLSSSSIVINRSIAVGRLSISSHSATLNAEVKSKDICVFGKNNIIIDTELHSEEIRLLSDNKIEINRNQKCKGYSIFSAKEVRIAEGIINEDTIIYGKTSIVPAKND